MAFAKTVDTGELLDQQKLSLYHVVTILLCVLIIVVDAADTGAINVSAPAILRAFHASRAVMGWAFASSAMGVFFGSLIFGYIGDRYGRKLGVILSVLLYSLPAIGTMLAGSLDQLMLWRFVTGLGIGGAIPNTIALLNEAAPKRFRASFVVIAFLGYPTGTGIAGYLAAKLIPIYGWVAVFVAVGIGGLALATLLLARLPESVRYLTAAQPQSPELRTRLMRLFPAAGIGPETQFVLRQERGVKVRLKELFAGDLKRVTSLLWASYFLESFTYLGYTAWLTTILESAGLSPTEARYGFSYAGFAGIVVLLGMARPLDHFGPMISVVSATVGIACMLLIGVPGQTVLLYTLLATVAHAFCSGTHNSLNSTVAMFYPTRIRSNGVGWASAAGRIGGTTGPLVLGYVFAAHVSLPVLLVVAAIPYLGVMALNVSLGRIYRQQFRVVPALAGE